MKRDGQDLVFSTGRKIYANNGVVGINDELEVREGYDGYIQGAWDNDGINGERSPWTPAKQAELCDYMIDIWQKRKTKLALPQLEEDE